MKEVVFVDLVSSHAFQVVMTSKLDDDSVFELFEYFEVEEPWVLIPQAE